MTKTPTPASHAVNTAPFAADLRGIDGVQPEALRIADRLDRLNMLTGYAGANMVRSLYAENTALRAKLVAEAAPASPAQQDASVVGVSQEGQTVAAVVMRHMIGGHILVEDSVQQPVKDLIAALHHAASQAQQDAPALSPRAHFIKGWDAARMYLGMQGSADSDIAMRKYMAAIPESYVDAPHAVPAQQDAPAAWMDPLTQDVINDARKRAWLTDFGAGGAQKAAAYNVALGPLAPAAPAADMTLVTKVDANNYCCILSLLGMEEEGDPVAEVQRLRDAAAPASQDAQDPVRALIAMHAAMLESSEYTYFELAYTRQTGWMAWITDKPFSGPVLNPDRKVLARGQGGTPDAACADAALAAQQAGGAA